MELNRAFQSTLGILAKVQPGDLAAPTPCASWDVRALVNHFVGTARWWAITVTESAESAESDEASDVDYAAGDFVAAYEESIELAVAAFGAEGALEKMIRLPFGEFPGAALLGLATTEQFTHGWDLARAIGHHTDLDPELAATLLSQARLTITDAYRGPDGQAFFGPAVEAPAAVSPADQLAAFLGRSV
jgi:uncharacterized protein (TIGR03086 family)